MASLYIHIPFCKKACHYCNFHFSTVLKNKTEIIAAICIELDLKKHFFNDDEVIQSIYFGGGTPSLLDPHEFDSLLNKIYSNYNISTDAEITVECNPDDIQQDLLLHYKKSGVNRLSIGVQSFNDEDLIIMNRSHLAQQAIDAIYLAANLGFEKLTIDLMYGLPNQDKNKWLKNLSIAASLPVNHISCYNLTVEEKTALKSLIKNQTIAATSETESAEQFEILMQWAKENGFEHYEISNFAKDAHYSKHNTSYWSGSKYLGIGPSAHSYDGDTTRYYNLSNNAQYLKLINSNEVFYDTEILEEHSRYNEYILTRLRTKWGINSSELLSSFGQSKYQLFLHQAQPFIDAGYLLSNGTIYTLSDNGKLLADHITSELFLLP
jgi:oxygen-independent coproporphyrinogen III oxidase